MRRKIVKFMCLLFAVGIMIILTACGTTEMTINGGEVIEVKVGDSVELTVEADGLEPELISQIEWTVTDNEDNDCSSAVDFDGLTIKAVEEGDYVVNGYLKNGMTKWVGSVDLTIEHDKLKINKGDSITVYMGEKETIKFSGKNLPDIDADAIDWSSDDTKIVKVKKGKLIPKGEGKTKVRGEYSDGERVWKGTVTVKVKYKKVSFTNGEIVIGHSGSAPVLIHAPSDEHCYVCFKSISGGSNFAFLVKKGQSKEVLAPLGKYELYYATGTTWYGKKYRFGPGTSYIKAKDTFNFYQDSMYIHGTELTLYKVINGNMESETVDASEFPG